MSYTNIRSSGYGQRKGKGVDGNFPLSPQPKSILRPKQWTEEVEEAHRFQTAGYRDAKEYQYCHKGEIERWPESGYVKKLQRKDGTFYYYSRNRECADKDVNKTKIYAY